LEIAGGAQAATRRRRRVEYERFAELATPHTATMAAVAAALVGAADAEDAAQEALLRAWNGWGDLREAAATRAWLLRITVNVCHNWRSGAFGSYRRRTQSLDDRSQFDSGGGSYRTVEDGPLGAFLAEPGPGASDHAAALDLRHAIGDLPDELRRIIALRFYAGMDATEIGAALDTPPATIRTRLRKAVGLLRDLLREQTPPTDASGRRATNATNTSIDTPDTASTTVTPKGGR